MSIVQRFFCWLNMHPKLDVIQSFGSAQHIGCPYCRREWGIHHGERVLIPWSPDLAEMYDFMGYETEAASERWRQYKV